MLPTRPTLEAVDVPAHELATMEVVDAEIIDADLDVPELNADEAQALTQHIRAATDVLWTLVARAHAGRAWKALGYTSWESYVSAEFNMSRSRSYQLLDHARVVSAIEAAAPVGTVVQLNERSARELKAHLEQVTEVVGESTAGLSPQEAEDTINDVLAEFRANLASHSESAGPSETPWGQPHDDYYSVTGHGGDAGTVLDDLSPPVAPGATATTPAGEQDPAAMEATRRMFQKVFELYSALDSLSSMPDAPDVAAAIPAERFTQVAQDLPQAVAWLQWFTQEWESATQMPEAS